LLFDGDNVIAQQVEDLFPVYGAGRAQRAPEFCNLTSYLLNLFQFDR
jgi:hypothetical protein